MHISITAAVYQYLIYVA